MSEIPPLTKAVFDPIAQIYFTYEGSSPIPREVAFYTDYQYVPIMQQQTGEHTSDLWLGPNFDPRSSLFFSLDHDDTTAKNALPKAERNSALYNILHHHKFPYTPEDIEKHIGASHEFSAPDLNYDPAIHSRALAQEMYWLYEAREAFNKQLKSQGIKPVGDLHEMYMGILMGIEDILRHIQQDPSPEGKGYPFYYTPDKRFILDPIFEQQGANYLGTVCREITAVQFIQSPTRVVDAYRTLTSYGIPVGIFSKGPFDIQAMKLSRFFLDNGLRPAFVAITRATKGEALEQIIDSGILTNQSVRFIHVDDHAKQLSSMERAASQLRARSRNITISPILATDEQGLPRSSDNPSYNQFMNLAERRQGKLRPFEGPSIDINDPPEKIVDIILETAFSPPYK